MTEDERKRLRELAAKATPGPWTDAIPALLDDLAASEAAREKLREALEEIEALTRSLLRQRAALAADKEKP